MRGGRACVCHLGFQYIRAQTQTLRKIDRVIQKHIEAYSCNTQQHKLAQQSYNEIGERSEIELETQRPEHIGLMSH